MAANTTISLVIEKLDRLGDSRMTEEVKKNLKESLDTTLKNLEDDQASHLTMDAEKIELLKAVYDAEDKIDAILASNILQKQKFFPAICFKLSDHSPARVNREKENIIGSLRNFTENKPNSSKKTGTSSKLSEDVEVPPEKTQVTQMENKPENLPIDPEKTQVMQMENEPENTQIDPEKTQVTLMENESENLPIDLEKTQVTQMENENVVEGALESNTYDLEDTAKRLGKSILRDDSSLFLLYVEGRSGGPHSTSLLWKTYCNIKDEFECCAWICASDFYEAIKGVIEQITGMKQEKHLPPTVLQSRIYRFLRNKKYLLVFYNIRTPDFWESLSSALPKSAGGRMILSVHGSAAAPDIPNDKFLRTIPNARFLGAIFGKELVQPSALKKDFCASSVEGSGIVGLKDEIEKLHQSICRRYQLQFMILVVGIPGSGKTSLVRTVYDNSHIEKKFEVRVWISVSDNFEERNLLIKIMEELSVYKERERLSLEELRKKLRHFFDGKKYLVVLDDVQIADTWEKLKKVFPISLNGSRVILITRDAKIAQNVDSSMYHTHNLRRLTDGESWELFSQRVKENALKENELQKLKKKILQRCKGVPAPILMLGGLLSTRKSYDEWINVLEPTQQKKKAGGASEDTKQGKKEAERDSENTMLEVPKAERRPSERSQQEENKEEVEKNKRVSKITQQVATEEENGVNEHTQLEKIEEEKAVDEDSGASEHTKQGEIEEEKAADEDRGISEQTKQGEIEEEKAVDKDRGVGEHPKQGEIEEEKAVDEDRGVREHPKQGEIEEEKEVDEDRGVSKHAKQGEIEEENAVGEDRGLSEHTKQGEIEEEREVKEEKRTVIASSDSENGEDSGASVFALGYRDLDISLRACLHYLCLFPRSSIRIRRLARLWIAEGLVKQTTTDNTEPKNEVEEYLFKLEQRNMITVKKLDGKPKTCSVEGLAYDNLREYTKRMGFFHVHPNWDNNSKLKDLSIRRLVEVDTQSSPSSEKIQKLRSYISFARGKGDKPADTVGNILRKITHERFGLLTLLDLEDVYKPVLKTETLKRLPLLRYVGLRRTFLDEIPESVGDIPCLETLDIKHTNITELPISICNSGKLRHLYMNWIDFNTSKQIPSSSLIELQTLSGLLISRDSPSIDWLMRMTGLRKLGLTCHTASIEKIISWLSKNTSLCSLRLTSVVDNYNKPSVLKEISMAKHKMLTDLYLVGQLSKGLSGIELPPKLRVLTLSVSELLEDPMPELGKLENLKTLRLYAKSYMGGEMIIKRIEENKPLFPKLEVLKLWMLLNLSKWEIVKGELPELKELEIRYCPKLQKPIGLEELTTLKKLTLTNMNVNFVSQVKDSLKIEVSQVKDSLKIEFTENNWNFTPSWEPREEQQQSEGATKPIKKLASIRSKSQINNKAPSRQASKQLLAV